MITQEELQAVLDYDEDTGIFTKNGRKVGGSDKDGYITIGIKYKVYKAHRLAWLYFNGSFPLNNIDHINHIRSDNRIINLREVSNTENHHNRGKHKLNTSGHVGVTWDKWHNKWKAQIHFNGKHIHLGYFSSKEEAIKARKEAEVKYNFHPNHGS